MALALDCQDLAAGQGVNSPVVRSLDGRAFVVLHLDALSPAEIQPLREATEQSRILLVPVLARCPTYPVLVLKFVLSDDPTNPYSVRDFLQAVLRAGGGDLYLYAGPDARPLGAGNLPCACLLSLALAIPTARGPPTWSASGSCSSGPHITWNSSRRRCMISRRRRLSPWPKPPGLAGADAEGEIVIRS